MADFVFIPGAGLPDCRAGGTHGRDLRALKEYW